MSNFNANIYFGTPVWTNEVPEFIKPINQLADKYIKNAKKNLLPTLKERDKIYEKEGPAKGKIRKLSVTVSLSDEKDYTGGELEFQFRNMDNPKVTRVCKEILPKGSVVVFPSFVWHRVKPIKKGVRYSLVMWNLGYPFQ